MISSTSSVISTTALSPKDPSFNLTIFEEVLRRCIARQKRAFLLYETILGFFLIIFLVSAVNCALNLVTCSSGLVHYISLPTFLHERSSPPTSNFLSLWGSKITNADEGIPVEVHQNQEQQQQQRESDDEKEEENIINNNDNNNKQNLATSITSSDSNNNNKNNNETTTSALPAVCFNQPLNLFWIFGLRPDLVCFLSFITSISLFVTVRGVFALRKPQRYINGLNASLKREYGWRFDEKVGKLIALSK